MKKLITERVMEGFIAGHGQGAEFPMDDDTLITPSAKDVARSNKIKFVDKETYTANNKAEKKGSCCETKEECCETKQEACCEEKPAGCEMSYDRQVIVEAVMRILKEKGILDKILDK